MQKILFFLAMALGSIGMLAQNNDKKPLAFSGYAEVYYQYDFNNPQNNNRPGFVYSHNRNNEVNLNLGFIKANFNAERVRANLAVATGTYMNANYAVEPGVLKNIYEATVGIRLSKSNNLWLDAGIMSSHIGFESAIGKDCWTLTRSMAAENSPYFETGAKISYATSDGKWFISGLVLNGWQHIQKIDGNSTLSFGHQLTYKPNEKIILNSSSFIGNDKADDSRRMRYFHNFYGTYQVNKEFGIAAGFDVGAEQKEKGSSSYNIWYTPTLILRYSPSERLSIAARGEYYQDKNGVIISTGTPDGFKTFGYSVNVDYYILSNVVWRTELRNLHSKDAVFIDRDSDLQKNSLSAVTSLAISF